MAKYEEGKVWLEPIEHVYIHKESGIKYKSVTTAISLIEHEFDSEGVAMAIEKQCDTNKQERYLGLTKDQILDFWDTINTEACDYGTHIHELIETYLLKNKWFFPTNTFDKKVIVEFNKIDFELGRECYPERIMFSEEYQLAGTADLIVDIDDVFFDLGDWKGLPIETPIFTNNGWKTMGNISKGDKVYDMDGKLCKVLHTSKVKNKKCYKINFDNNETIVSDFEHRWLISFYRGKKIKDVVMTTEELYFYVKEINESNKRWSHKIPKIKILKPLENEMVNLPIDPYLFGVWLGDECSADMKGINMCDGIWCELKRRGHDMGGDISQGGCGKITTRTVFDLQIKLRELNLLKDKHLPEIFLQGSYEQRLLVLQGFMDSNGYYNKGCKEFVMSTTKKWQAKAFNQITSSLGIKTTIISYNKKVNGEMINLIDVLFSTDGLNPFLSRTQTGVECGKQNNSGFKNIMTVELVDSTPTRCIEVDSKTHTFLYGESFSITHNTNKEFNYYSKYSQMLLAPFEHLQDCQYVVYTIQLSTYALMYEMETGKKCRHIWIGHWDKETEVWSKIPVMYMRHEALKLMKHHKMKQLTA